MKFTPKYTVSYHGEWYETGEEFDIDPADAEEMKEHGEIVEESAPPAVEKPRRGGRRKADDEPGADETSDG